MDPLSADVADAVVIGAGPNGLVAAIMLARKGWDVVVLERAGAPGGAVRSEELTLPGFVHDTYSAFYGLLHATPVFRELSLGTRVRWAQFDTVVGANVSPNDGAFIHADAAHTARDLGADGDAWRDLVSWWRDTGTRFFETLIAPVGALRPPLRLARRTGIRGGLSLAREMVAPAAEFARARFATETARALLASGASHSDVSVAAPGSTPATLLLAMFSQTLGMPIPVGGAQALTDALVALLDEAGGKISCGNGAVRVIVERGRARAVETVAGRVVRARHAVIADTGPKALIDLAGADEYPARFLEGVRAFRYGTGVFKIDVALDGITPWLDERARSTGVVHLTGTLDDMARANSEAITGAIPAQPMIIAGQQTIADPTRAPDGKHTLWIETHVPGAPVRDGATDAAIDGWHAAEEMFRERVFDRIEAHAPGFRARILGFKVHTPSDLQARNPNLVGGDVGGGSNSIDQQLVFRPVAGWFRYRTPVKALYLCSASAHPGGGVHGMGGYNCARRVLRDARTPAGVLRTAGGSRRAPRRD